MGPVPSPTTLADRYDAVVVGSGPNGLVAANLLADEGWRVVVLEAMPTPGGAVRSSELIESGFVNDHCSAFYPLAAASPVSRRLDLGAHGLRWRHAPSVLAHPTLEGDGPELSRSLDVTAASLDADHPGDGDAWRSLHRRWDDLEPALFRLLFTPFPPVRGGAGLLRRLPPRDLVRFARFALLPVRRLGEEEFGGRGGPTAARRRRAAHRPATRGEPQRVHGLAHVRARADLRLPGARGRCVGPHRSAGRAGCMPRAARCTATRR